MPRASRRHTAGRRPLAPESPWAIEALCLSHRFGTHVALRDVTLRIGWGERVAVLGPNGAGKSTLLRILGTLTPPSAGELRVVGLSPRREKASIRRRLGIVAHQTFLFGALTAAENLLFYARLYEVRDPDERVQQLLARVGLSARAGTRARQLSRGMQQRLTLARALLHAPEILLLDEPDTGLDQDGLAILASVVQEQERGAVIMTTHDVERATMLCERAIILAAGRVVRDTATRSLGGDTAQTLTTTSDAR